MTILNKLFYMNIIPCFLGSIVFMFYFFGLRVNYTSSMPIGLYKQCSLKRIQKCDIITFCLPKPIALTGKSRDYIGSGSCPGNAIPLLKKVIALPGDKVILSSNAIVANGISYFAPQERIDHQGRRVIHWVKNETYRVTKKVWVYGSSDPIHSWDSRYFGGIPMKNILGVYKPLWVIK